MKNKLRAFTRNSVLDIAGLFAKPSNGIHLLNSHFLTMEENLDSNYFDDQLKNLSNKSTIIPFAEAVELINGKKTIDHSLIAFSYDDGYAECHSHIAPVLERYNGQACFFINPNFASGDEEYAANFLNNNVFAPIYKKAMTWEQIIDLHQRGHIIGAHTMDHIRATDPKYLSEMDYQIGACKEIIEDRISAPCDYFAFTYGRRDRDFNEDSVAIAERYYKYIFGASHWQNYYSYNGRVYNRRHCEPFWPVSHINYFLSKGVRY